MKSVNIIIKGAYGEKNLGDDLLMVITNSLFESFGLTCYFLVPSNTGYLEKYITNNLYKGQNNQINADVLVYGGGTQFFHFRKTNSNIKKKLLKKILKNPFRIIGLLFKKFTRTSDSISSRRKVGIGIGIGPFEEPGGFEVLSQTKQNLKKFDLLLLRDGYSYDLMKSEMDNVFLLSDLCFLPSRLLPFSVVSKEEAAKRFDVTIIIRDWVHSDDDIHVDSVLNFICLHKDKSINVVLFASDSVCEKKLRKNNIQYVIWDPFKYSFHEFLDIIYDTKIVVSSRYHGCVLSALFGIPFISINIDPKLALFSQDIYTENLGWNYPYEIEDLECLLSKVENNYANFESKIFAGVKMFQKRMEYAEAIIGNFMRM